MLGGKSDAFRVCGCAGGALGVVHILHRSDSAAFKNVHAAQLHSRLTAGWLGAFALQMLHSLHAPGFRYVHLPQFHSLRDNLAA